ncbi:MAG TPA: SCO family protein [Candidatus Polarisedimenticolaceae bacterium]|nr:SCO family protein [Candidatus Polarisedimenticolaceae bacterium]
MSSTPFYRNPFVIAFLAGIVTLTAIRPLLRREPAPPPVLGQLPEFSLTDQEGRPYGSAELSGQVYIASFFFTRCGSICPALMHNVLKLQDGFAARGIDGVRLVSITVDPENDTPAVLKEYGQILEADPARWTFLTGPTDKVEALVVGGFKTPMDPGETGPGSAMDIAHTGKIVLVDGSGRIRGYYGTDEMGLDEAFNRAQHVLKEQRQQAKG